MFDIEIIRTRANGLARAHKIILIVAVSIIILWLAGILLILNQPQVDFLSEYQLDKLVHFGGGIFVAAMLYILFATHQRKPILYLTFAIGVLWEIFELAFLPNQILRFRHEFLWWSSDTFFDLTVDVLGAYFWINLVSYPADNVRETQPAKTQ